VLGRDVVAQAFVDGARGQFVHLDGAVPEAPELDHASTETVPGTVFQNS